MINVDANPTDANWLRKGEDLRTPDGKRVKTRKDLLRVIQDLGLTMEKFRKLPIAKDFKELLN